MYEDNPFERRSNRSFTFGRQTSPGYGIEGTIESIGKPFQQTKYNPDKSAPRVPDTWPSGDPKMAVGITLQTNLNEPNEEYPVDDGLRSLIVEMEYKQDGKMYAIQEAVKAAGGRVPEPGGYLGLWFVDLDPQSKNPDNPRKRFRGAYRLPVGAGSAAFGAPPQQAQPQAAAPQYAPGGGGFPTPQQERFNTGGAVYQPGPQQVVNQGPQQQLQQAQNPYGQPQAPAPYGGQPQAPAPYPAPIPAAQREQQVQQAQGQFPGANFSAAPQPATPQPAAPAPQQTPVDPDDVRGRLAAGHSDAQIMHDTGYPLDAISAIRNLGPLV